MRPLLRYIDGLNHYNAGVRNDRHILALYAILRTNFYNRVGEARRASM